MLNGVDLLNRYKDEKAMVIGSEAERTGLEDFPSFKEWKAEYEAEWAETHVTVDVKEADAMFDAIVDEAFEAEEEDSLTAEGEDPADAEADEEEAAPEAEPQTGTQEPAPAPKAKAKPPLKGVKKTDIRKTKKPDVRAVKKPNVKKSPPLKKAKAPSKADKAKKIFDRYFDQPKWDRKRIIAKFVSDVQMTPAGASTYYQSFKRKTETK